MGWRPVAVGALAVFVAVERRSPDPMLPLFGPRPLIVAGLALGALGMLNLLLLKENSGYPALLATLLGLGVGMGLLTTAVVTAAVGGIPPERAGGVNNTARQAGVRSARPWESRLRGSSAACTGRASSRGRCGSWRSA